MIRILFICYGNICRSTMAEFIFKNMVSHRTDFYVDSAGTSREELGNPVDRRTAAKLAEHGIPCGKHKARQITARDYEDFDIILLMDRENQWGIRRIIPEDKCGKMHLLLEFADGAEYKNSDGTARDVSDPWYTHDFEQSYRDITAGCEGLLEYLEHKRSQRMSPL